VARRRGDVVKESYEVPVKAQVQALADFAEYSIPAARRVRTREPEWLETAIRRVHQDGFEQMLAFLSGRVERGEGAR
jgi:hypothetical protein